MAAGAAPAGAVAGVRRRLAEARRVVVLTGAGISAESGMPTFRGPGGIWKKFRAEDLATPEAFARDPRLVWEWYDDRRAKLLPLKPNPAHEALAALEEAVAGFTLVTQNIDDLHRVAGSRRLLEMHGNIWRVRCTGCGRRGEDRRVPIPVPPPCPSCGALLRPDIVWFGETLDPAVLDECFAVLQRAEVMLVVGTSGVVQPAASMAALARRAGAFVAEVNIEPPAGRGAADVHLAGPAGEIVPKLVP